MAKVIICLVVMMVGCMFVISIVSINTRVVVSKVRSQAAETNKGNITQSIQRIKHIDDDIKCMKINDVMLVSACVCVCCYIPLLAILVL